MIDLCKCGKPAAIEWTMTVHHRALDGADDAMREICAKRDGERIVFKFCLGCLEGAQEAFKPSHDAMASHLVPQQ